MTDTNSAQSNGEAQTAHVSINQRPSFTRWDDPITRSSFLGHWLLSLVLLVALPLGALWTTEALGQQSMQLPLMLFAGWPALQLYWVSTHRRLIDMGARTTWHLLIAPFVVVSVFNFFDGAMGSLQPALANSSTINPVLGSLLLLPAVVLHFVLMLRRGATKSKTKS